MTTDYEAIAQLNKTKYGTEVSNYGSIISDMLYSDRTHFVYELLQNAEDAGASQAHFSLFTDHIEFRHNGRLFNDKDVIAICGIGRGTKAEDMTKIGKFGIGFKSVYAYTTTPEVHSSDEHFLIEHYVFPHAIAPIELRPKDTCIVIPFNRADLDLQQAYFEIAERLKSLGSETILFLRSIKEIAWQKSDGSHGHYLSESQLHPSDPAVQIAVITNEDGLFERWMIFERAVDFEATPLRAEIAFALENTQDGNQFVIRRVKRPKLVVFFPTERETHFGFLIQGPYKTTPARDNIPLKSTLNSKLVEETAELLIKALIRLRADKLLTVESLDVFATSELSSDDPFMPILRRVRDVLQNQPFLPSLEGGYISGKLALLARGSEMTEWITDFDLAKLYNAPVKWLSTAVTVNKTPRLYNFLINQVRVQELDPLAIVRRIANKSGFIEGQSDDWLRRFYVALDRSPSLVSYLREREFPLLRLQDNSHVAARTKEQGKPLAYLPPDGDTVYPIVKRDICKSPEILRFLKNRLDLIPPDRLTELLDFTLPKYQQRTQITLDEYQADLVKIFEAVESLDRRRSGELIEHLRTTSFIWAQNASDGKKALVVPRVVVPRTSAYRDFYAGNPDVWILVDDLTKYADRLQKLDLLRADPVRAKQSNSSGYVLIVSERGRHLRGINGFDPSCAIDGLEYAVQHPSIPRSEFIWNQLLVSLKNHIQGEVESSSRQSFSDAERSLQYSPMGKLVCENAWLPTTQGTWAQPSDLALDELPPSFLKDEILAKRLQMRVWDLKGISQQLSIQEDDAIAIKDAIRYHPDLLQEFLSKVRELRQMQPNISGNERPADPSLSELYDPIDLGAEMQDTFSRPGQTQLRIPEPTHSPVQNTQLREERIRKEIETFASVSRSVTDKRANPIAAPIIPRYVSSRHWQKKDPQTREFLLQQYGGRCQICGDTFPIAKDGSPYFEGVYMVQQSQGKWFDRPGNVLCLCANHAAQFLYGSVESPDFGATVLKLPEGQTDYFVALNLCGKPTRIRFTQRHIIDIQAILKFRPETSNPIE